MDLNLFDRLDEERRLKKQIDAKDDVPGARARLDQLRKEQPSTTNSSLGKVFVSYKDVYVTKTEESLDSLSGEIKEETKFKQRISDAWAATLKDSTVKLGQKSLIELVAPLLSSRYEGLKNQSKALSEPSKNIDAASRTLHAGFRALIEFRDGLYLDLDALLKKEAGALTVEQEKTQGAFDSKQKDLVLATRGLSEASTLKDEIKKKGADTSIVDARYSILVDEESKARQSLETAKSDLETASKNVSALAGAWKQLKADVSRETNTLLRKLAGSQLNAATELETASNFVGQAAGK